ncbi:MAG: hypothetical protein J0H02_06815 [Armatimonadetes bacterium]|nr:hypothetical protein [Armatimonadota bacterium]
MMTLEINVIITSMKYTVKRSFTFFIASFFAIQSIAHAGTLTVSSPSVTISAQDGGGYLYMANSGSSLDAFYGVDSWVGLYFPWANTYSRIIGQISRDIEWATSFPGDNPPLNADYELKITYKCVARADDPDDMINRSYGTSRAALSVMGGFFEFVEMAELVANWPNPSIPEVSGDPNEKTVVVNYSRPLVPILDPMTGTYKTTHNLDIVCASSAITLSGDWQYGGAESYAYVQCRLTNIGNHQLAPSFQ